MRSQVPQPGTRDSAPLRTFATTHWSLIGEAAAGSTAGSQEALEKLCRAYWYPLYAYVRRSGFSPEDAEDATQEFLAWFIESKHITTADPAKGRFRSFLLVRLKFFLSDLRKKERAQKRGGGRKLLSLDALSAEERFEHEPSVPGDADKLFDRNWAVSILERAVDRLREEYAAADRIELYNALKQFRPGEQGNESYADLARRLDLSESALKSAIFRFRRRHGELLREEVARTVSTAGEVNPELRYLVEVLASQS